MFQYILPGIEGVKKWLVNIVEPMYRVTVNGTFSELPSQGRITSRLSVKPFIIYHSAGGTI